MGGVLVLVPAFSVKGAENVNKMKIVQSALRLTGAARNVVTKRTNVSMKQPYDLKNNVGLYPATEAYHHKIIKTQQEWAKTPELYVWQKRGTIDAVPYYATYALCAIGMAYVLKVMYEMSYPKKPQ